MKRSLHFLAVLLMLPLLAMLVAGFSQTTEFQTGVYGIHGSESVILELKEDHQFYYHNESDPANHVEVTGKWTQDGRSIILTDYADGVHIANKWRIDADQPCIRSQMTDFLVIRLCLTS